MKMQVINDIDEIAKILKDPRIYEVISDDDDPPADQFEIPLTGYEYVAGYVEDEIIGVMVYHQETGRLECHIQVLPEYRPQYARDFAAQALAYGKANGQPIFAEIPACYPNVIRFAESFGFQIIANQPDAYTKHGKASDLLTLRCD